MLAKWRPVEHVDIHYEFSTLTSAIALKTLFDLQEHRASLGSKPKLLKSGTKDKG